MPPKVGRLAKQQLWFPAGRYFLRTIKLSPAAPFVCLRDHSVLRDDG